MTDKPKMREADIDDLLARAGRVEITPASDLLARIIEDADHVADQRSNRNLASKPARRPGLLANMLSGLGGWPAMAGLVSAAVVGISVGYASPDTLTGLTEGYVSIGDSQSLGDFMPTITDFLGEG